MIDAQLASPQLASLANLQSLVGSVFSGLQTGGAAGSAMVIQVGLSHLDADLLKNMTAEEEQEDFSWFVDVPRKPTWITDAPLYKGLDAELTSSAAKLSEILSEFLHTGNPLWAPLVCFDAYVLMLHALM